jgi:hypothetical protein
MAKMSARGWWIESMMVRRFRTAYRLRKRQMVSALAASSPDVGCRHRQGVAWVGVWS